MKWAMQEMFPKKRLPKLEKDHSRWENVASYEVFPRSPSPSRNEGPEAKMVCSCWSTIAHQGAEATRSKQRKQAERQAMIDEQLVAAEAKAMQDRSHCLYKVTKAFNSGKR